MIELMKLGFKNNKPDAAIGVLKSWIDQLGPYHEGLLNEIKELKAENDRLRRGGC